MSKKRREMRLKVLKDLAAKDKYKNSEMVKSSVEAARKDDADSIPKVDEVEEDRKEKVKRLIRNHSGKRGISTKMLSKIK